MNAWYRNRQMPAANPLANALVIVVGALVLGLSLIVGFVAFIALGTLFLVLGAVVAIRLWWVRRRFEKQQRRHGRGPRSDAGGRQGAIEGEFHVVERDDPADRRP